MVAYAWRAYDDPSKLARSAPMSGLVSAFAVLISHRLDGGTTCDMRGVHGIAAAVDLEAMASIVFGRSPGRNKLRSQVAAGRAVHPSLKTGLHVRPLTLYERND